MIGCQRWQLSVSIGRINYIPINNRHFTNAASCDELGCKGTYTTQTYNHHVFLGK
jgi:hypothetical protein